MSNLVETFCQLRGRLPTWLLDLFEIPYIMHVIPTNQTMTVSRGCCGDAVQCRPLWEANLMRDWSIYGASTKKKGSLDKDSLKARLARFFLMDCFEKAFGRIFRVMIFCAEVRYTEGLGGLEDNFAG